MFIGTFHYLHWMLYRVGLQLYRGEGRGWGEYEYIITLSKSKHFVPETAMGINQNVQLNCESQFAAATKSYAKYIFRDSPLSSFNPNFSPFRLSDIIHRQAYSPWKRISCLNNIFSNDRIEQMKQLTILHDETKHVIKLRRQLLDDITEHHFSRPEESTGEKRRLAFLDMLLLSQKCGVNISDKNIQEEVDTFMFAVRNCRKIYQINHTCNNIFDFPHTKGSRYG